MTAPDLADAARKAAAYDRLVARLRSVLDNLAVQASTDHTLTVPVVLTRIRVAIDTPEEIR